MCFLEAFESCHKMNDAIGTQNERFIHPILTCTFALFALLHFCTFCTSGIIHLTEGTAEGTVLSMGGTMVGGRRRKLSNAGRCLKWLSFLFSYRALGRLPLDHQRMGRRCAVALLYCQRLRQCRERCPSPVQRESFYPGAALFHSGCGRWWRPVVRSVAPFRTLKQPRGFLRRAKNSTHTASRPHSARFFCCPSLSFPRLYNNPEPHNAYACIHLLSNSTVP